MKSVPVLQKWICQPHPSMVVGDVVVVVVVVGTGRMLYDIRKFIDKTYNIQREKSNTASSTASNV